MNDVRMRPGRRTAVFRRFHGRVRLENRGVEAFVFEETIRARLPFQGAYDLLESPAEDASDRRSFIFRKARFGCKSTFEAIISIEHDNLLIHPGKPFITGRPFITTQSENKELCNVAGPYHQKRNC